ncbi:MAG: hypothetical protein WCO42_10460 [bacterium]
MADLGWGGLRHHQELNSLHQATFLSGDPQELERNRIVTWWRRCGCWQAAR